MVKRDPDNFPYFPSQEWCAWTIPEIVINCFTEWLNVRLFCLSVITRGVHLIVALEFCKANCLTYLYSIHFNLLIFSSLIEIQFLVFEPRLRKQICTLFWTCPVDTEHQGGGGRGYSDIFIHTLARVIFGVKILSFNIFGGFQKNKYFLFIDVANSK